jgi:endonuclease/exonuclease/phosphatase family metal-dependent hydrolase
MKKLWLVFGLTGLRAFGFLSDPWLGTADIQRVTGDPIRVHEPAARAELSVVTWNIERGLAYDSILSVLRTLNPDVILLQEADQGCRRTGYRNVPKDLATALNMNWVAAGEFQELGEARGRGPAITGQAILSRLPIAEAAGLGFRAQDRWRWSINPVQPRRGGRLALRAVIGGVVMYNTHIESGGDEGLQQRQMAEIVADQATQHPDTPVLIAGDFNNPPVRRARTLQSLLRASFVDALGDASHREPTSLGQSHPIDWIFIKRLGPGLGRVVPAFNASDHSPVFARLSAPASAMAGSPQLLGASSARELVLK